MHQINLLDETFDKNQAHHYNLAIQYGLNGLSFCLFDTVKNKYIAFRHYPEIDSRQEALSPILESDDLLQLKFKETRFLYDAGKNTLVPDAFFDESRAETLYKFNLGDEKCSSIHFNKIQDPLALNIFAYSQSILTKFRKVFPKIEIYHRTTPFIENLMEESARWPRSNAFVYIHKGILDIGVAHLRKLEFFNSFNYQNNADIAYYILNVLEQFNLSATLTEVYISVDLEKHEELFNYLQSYLQHIKFIKPSEKFTYSYIFDEFQLTRFANLFNLALCV